MNKILREEMEYLITCDDKAITPDVRDDVKMTLDYIDELEEEYKRLKERNEINIDRNVEAYKIVEKLRERIDKALKLLDSYKLGKYDYALTCAGLLEFEDILRGEDNK